MAETPGGQFACPHCGRQYRWKTKLAGRAAKCKCGGQFRVSAKPGDPAQPLEEAHPRREPPVERPAAPTTPIEDHDHRHANADVEIEDDDTYALNLPEERTPRPAQASGSGKPAATVPAASAGAVDGRCPSCTQAITPGAVICVKCGFNLQEGRKMEVQVTADADDGPPVGGTAAGAPDKIPSPRMPIASGVGTIGSAASDEAEEALAKQQTFIDWILPPILIALGVMLHFLHASYFGADAVQGILGTIIAVGVRIVLWVPLLVFVLFAAAKLFDMSFGPLGLALFKLMGIALLPGAASDLISAAIPGGFIIGFTVAVIIYWVLLTVLFSLDALDAFYVMLGILFAQTIAGFLAGMLILMLVGLLL